MKNTLGIILLTAWVSVSVTWLIMYLLMSQNYFNKEVEDIWTVKIENIWEDIIDAWNNKIEDDVYQFLLDTKKVYCKIFELSDYYYNSMLDVRDWKIDLGGGWNTLVYVSKKTLEKANILWLSWVIENYINDYSNSPFSESVNLIRLIYEYTIKGIKNNYKLQNGDTEWWSIDVLTYNDSVKEAHATLLKVLLEEYKAVRWEDETLRPEEESKLLDIKNWHSTEKTEDEPEGDNNSEWVN